MTTLSPAEHFRYSRHLVLPDVGIDGQIKLKEAAVLLIGIGGLGSPAALYLAAAGIGRIGLVDYDVVEFSNLQRQIIHTTKDIGNSKLDSAKNKIYALNPEVMVETYEMQLSAKNALSLFEKYNVIIDGTDNFPARYLVNDACVLSGKPNVYGSVFQFEGQASVFAVKDGPCYRCLYPEPPQPGEVPNCAEGGVLGVMPGIIGTIQAAEAIKLILGKGEPLVGRLLFLDAMSMRFHEIKLRKNPDCPVCGINPTIRKLVEYEQFCGMPPGDAIQDGITVDELRSMMEAGERLYLLDVREPFEYNICHLEGSHLIPQQEIHQRLHELASDMPIVVYCKGGTRSKQVQKFLKESGFKNVRNLIKGISAWAAKYDPSMPSY